MLQRWLGRLEESKRMQKKNKKNTKPNPSFYLVYCSKSIYSETLVKTNSFTS